MNNANLLDKLHRLQCGAPLSDAVAVRNAADRIQTQENAIAHLQRALSNKDLESNAYADALDNLLAYGTIPECAACGMERFGGTGPHYKLGVGLVCTDCL